MRFFQIALALLVPIISGCWQPQSSVTTLEFSRSRGTGNLKIQWNAIACVNGEKPCEGEELEKEIAGLKKAPTNLGRMLRALRFSEVNVILKPLPDKRTFSGEAFGRFDSLTQLPFFESLRVTRPEENETVKGKAGQRHDLVLELTVRRGDLTLGGTAATYIFRSSDKDAEILEFRPLGRLDPMKRTVTWDKFEFVDDKVTLSVRLKGRPYIVE